MANYDHYTDLAIKSIFLGANTHDAAVLCGKTAHLMREELHRFCKKRNLIKYQELLIEAESDGYTSTPTAYFRACMGEFISFKEIYPSFMYESLEEMAKVGDYLERSLSFSNAHRSMKRARRDAWDGIVTLARK